MAWANGINDRGLIVVGVGSSSGQHANRGNEADRLDGDCQDSRSLGSAGGPLLQPGGVRIVGPGHRPLPEKIREFWSRGVASLLFGAPAWRTRPRINPAEDSPGAAYYLCDQNSESWSRHSFGT
jgi:hypothetical protein